MHSLEVVWRCGPSPKPKVAAVEERRVTESPQVGCNASYPHSQGGWFALAQYAVSIEKAVSFGGVDEAFSNVYTFDTGTFEGFDDVPIINRLVAIEKGVFGDVVNFTTARSYGIAGLAATNVMREIIDLSGTGAQAGESIYAETAVLVTFDLPRSAILRRRRIGRKWLHLCKLGGPLVVGALAIAGRAALPADAQGYYKQNYGDLLVNEAWSGGAEFASNGDPFTNSSVDPWLEHRQFHRGT